MTKLKNSVVKSILLAGVGGQGILRASDIISMALMESGFDVKKSEVHGMAQRGGCVTSFVRYGEKVFSPLAWEGSVDIMLSFEKLETLRYLDFMKRTGKVVIGEEEIFPPDVNLGISEYPHNVPDIVRKYFRSVKVVNISSLASKAGNPRTANTIMIGVLSRYLPVKPHVWEEIIKTSFPAKLIQVNINAFNIGSIA